MHDVPRARKAMLGVVVAALIGVVVASAVETVTADPHTGEGWVGGPIMLVLAGAPLAAVALGLRSSRPVVARRTAIGALVLAIATAGVLAAQLADANETWRDRALQMVVTAIYLAVVAVEIPAARGATPASGRRRG